MGKGSTESDEKQSSGKEANADRDHKNGMRKGRGLLGGDKVLRSKEGKGEERTVRLGRDMCLWEVKSWRLWTWKKTGNWVIGEVDCNISV